MKFRDDLERGLYYRAQIDYSYWRLQEIMSHNAAPESPLEAMIDKATGYDKVKVMQCIDEVKYLIGVIIRCKIKIDSDPSGDRKFLKEVKSIQREKP